MENLRRVLAAIFFRVNLLQSSRFGEALRDVQDHLDSRNFYALNPAFDNPAKAGAEKVKGSSEDAGSHKACDSCGS